jgi:transposase
MQIAHMGCSNMGCLKVGRKWQDPSQWMCGSGLLARGEAGESRRVVAQALSLSPSRGVKWAQRLRATGSAAAGKMGGHRPRLRAGAYAGFLRKQIAQAALTLRGRVAELAGRGLAAAYRTLWSFVHREGLSFKKTVLPGAQDRPDIARKRARWQKYRGLVDPRRRVFISSSTRPGPRRTWLPCAEGGHVEKGARPKRPPAIGRR